MGKAKEYGYKAFVFSTLTDLYFDDINDYGEKQIFSLIDVSAFDAIVIMPETFKADALVKWPMWREEDRRLPSIFPASRI